MGRPKVAHTLPLVTREEFAQRVLQGENLFVRHGKVIRVPASWISKHPGGSLAIQHFVGRDASNETDAYHDDHNAVLIDKYAVGRVNIGDEGWEPLVPPVALGWMHQDGRWVKTATALRHGSEIMLLPTKETGRASAETRPTRADLEPGLCSLDRRHQYRQSLAYHELHKKVTQAGLYQCRYLSGYGPEVVRYLLFATLSYVAYQHQWYIPSAFFLGLVWHQLSFTAHDLGHMGVTHNWFLDRLIAIGIADFCGGLSIGWWVDNHNIHHLVTNQPSHDPDIEHIPFFAISTHFLRSLHSSYYNITMPFDWAGKIFLRMQDKLFYVVLSLARFNLYALSWGFLWRSRPFWNQDKSFLRGTTANRWRFAWTAEIVGLSVFTMWYIGVLRGIGSWKMALLYAYISHVATSPLHVQLVLSHFGCSTEDLGPGESFLHRQLRTTVDIACPPYLAFLHGGLHLQVTHHLFPRLPRHNLLAASKLVREVAKEQGLVYQEFGTFVQGNLHVLGVLREVAKQASIIGKVAQGEVDEALSKVRAVQPAVVI